MPDEPSPDFLAKLSQAGGTERGLLHFLLENIPDRIYFKDKESKFIRISRAMAQYFGFGSALEAIGKSDFDFFTQEHAQQAYDDEQELMRSGEPIVGKVEKETLPTGEIRWALTTKMPLQNAHGEVIGTCGISKDFTAQKALEEAVEEKNAELARRQEELQRTLGELEQAHENLKGMQQQLIDAEKVQMVGRLANGVAHEIRNPLNNLSAGIDFFASEPAVAEAGANAAVLDEMRNAVRRADAVISTLMDSTSAGGFNLESCQAEAVIRPALDRAGADRSGVKIRAEFAGDLPELQLDRSKMEQVLDGIFKNALDAMPEGGELTVRTESRTLSEADIEREPGSRSAERFRAGDAVVAIEIDDTGAGVPAGAIGRVFDPFFTTKETGAGAGMGLTVCRRIVQLHRGALQISNREGGGARVTILLKTDKA